MQVRVSSRHTSVSDRDRQLIVEKIDRLAKFLPGMDSAEIHFSEERNPRIRDKEVCEVTLRGHGHHVRCTANGVDHLTAVDLAIDKLENKLHKLKTKLIRHRSHRDRAAKRVSAVDLNLEDALEQVSTNGSVAVLDPVAEADATAAEEAELAVEYAIVKTKKVEKLTLSPLEAALRMDLVGHDFYFFVNVETGESAVVYRRDDGDVGLIDHAAGVA